MEACRCEAKAIPGQGRPSERTCTRRAMTRPRRAVRLGVGRSGSGSGSRVGRGKGAQSARRTQPAHFTSGCVRRRGQPQFARHNVLRGVLRAGPTVGPEESVAHRCGEGMANKAPFLTRSCGRWAAAAGKAGKPGAGPAACSQCLGLGWWRLCPVVVATISGVSSSAHRPRPRPDFF